MGLFSKETCAICGKEVGAMSRSKLEDKQFVCNECRTSISLFMRCDYLTLDEFKQAKEQIKHDNEWIAEQQEEWTHFERRAGSAYLCIRFYKDAGAFVVKTNRPREPLYPTVFYISEIREYDPSRNHLDSTVGFTTGISVNPDDITLTEKKDSDGKCNGWVISFPYNHKAIRQANIEISNRFKADDVKMAYDQLVNFVKYRYDEKRIKKEQQAQTIAMASTLKNVAKAAMSGGDVKGAVEEGVQLSEDISKGKVKKGLFGILKRKD